MAFVRLIGLGGGPTGMALTHHDSLLIVAEGDGVAFIDAIAAVGGRKNAVLGVLTDGTSGAGRVYANATADGRMAFISDERTQTISVIDLTKAAREGYSASALVGKIPVGNSPIALTFSPDGKRLFTTSQAAPASWKWPTVCRPEGAATDVPPNHPQGAITVFDVAGVLEAGHGLIGATAAGCNPVRLVLSANGERAYVSVRGMNELRVFDTGRLVDDSAHALLATVPVGPAPVGVAVIDDSRKLVVTSSNRFAGPTDPQFLTVIDATRVSEGRSAVIGTLSAGAFPRELRVTADGRTLILTNFGSRTIQMFDIERLPLASRQ